jgi:hypothetical protein
MPPDNTQGGVHPFPTDIALAQLGSENLDGEECKDMAQLVISNGGFPQILSSLISNSNVNECFALDNVDTYGEEYLESYTSPRFHPGRLMLLGDAAYTLAASVHGNHGISVGLNDAITFAKLFCYYFSPVGRQKIHDETGYSSDPIVLEEISKKFSENRLSEGYKCLENARTETTWKPTEPGFLSNLLGFKPAPHWAASNFQDMMARGRTKLDESISWPLVAK